MSPHAFERRRLILGTRILGFVLAIALFALIVTAAGNLVGLGR